MANAVNNAQYGDRAASAEQPSGYTPWSADEIAEITQATVGQAMSAPEFDAWVDAFKTEHGGRTPWQDGPFDAANNLIDHLLALGESRRTAASGSYGSATDATGNPMQDRGVTPQFWNDAYLDRYRAPTYAPGMSDMPWSTDQYQYTPPGYVPNTAAPTGLMLDAMGAPMSDWYPLIRRPYYENYPAMSPGEWAQSGNPISTTTANLPYISDQPNPLYNY